MKKFEEAKIEVIRFAVEDVITASSGGAGDVGSPGEDD